MKMKVLRVTKNHEWKRVFISTDETNREQEKPYRLRQELRERRGNGEKHIFIQWGRIVESDKSSMQGTQTKQGMDKTKMSPHKKNSQEMAPPGGAANQHLQHTTGQPIRNATS